MTPRFRGWGLTRGIRENREAHRRSLGCPRFPVESCGFGRLHVVLFRENHISGRQCSGEAGNLGPLGMTKGWVALSMEICLRGMGSGVGAERVGDCSCLHQERSIVVAGVPALKRLIDVEALFPER